MIDHISLAVADLALSEAFYTAILEPLGINLCEVDGSHCSYEIEGSDDFSIHMMLENQPRSLPPHQMHFAFRAPSRAAVDEFFRRALAKGGKDDGSPGLRPEYHSDYYAAFVIDPNGYRIEAVCHLAGDPH